MMAVPSGMMSCVHFCCRSRGLVRGLVAWRRSIKNETIKSGHLDLSPSGSLSLNRRNKHTKDEAQDCKTLHGSPPFLRMGIP
jgi:hypothetical protein